MSGTTTQKNFFFFKKLLQRWSDHQAPRYVMYKEGWGSTEVAGMTFAKKDKQLSSLSTKQNTKASTNPILNPIL